MAKRGRKPKVMETKVPLELQIPKDWPRQGVYDPVTDTWKDDTPDGGEVPKVPEVIAEPYPGFYGSTKSALGESQEEQHKRIQEFFEQMMKLKGHKVSIPPYTPYAPDACEKHRQRIAALEAEVLELKKGNKELSATVALQVQENKRLIEFIGGNPFEWAPPKVREKLRARELKHVYEGYYEVEGHEHIHMGKYYDGFYVSAYKNDARKTNKYLYTDGHIYGICSPAGGKFETLEHALEVISQNLEALDALKEN